uniref:Uncharacterized protein AlNc14C54G4166 n=1 Tax=Albugo laibachii Nc14 TaxID=890382 RepID=F0WBX8_9STRA|nr:hypothetical protein TRIADDRAFT_27796 [Albugo laibachii Nc14]|eukprot:CCA18657.1 hypothetical protein TRIADDRAFT_27796 [Albugo laibachii Nc14]
MTLPADNNATNCPVFYPSQEQFTSFSSYIRQEVEPKCSDIGICKIVPPKGWFIRNYDDVDFVVEHPVSQHVAGKKGVFNIDLVEKKSLTAQEFKEIAAQCSDGEPRDLFKMDEIERAFWKSMRSTMDAPIYGADIEGSLFDSSCNSTWNLNDLKTILCRIELPGVTRSMLYFGMWRAMFAFHTEDMDLYSINYLHHGKPKFWYCIPPHAASAFERAAQAMYPEKYHSCHQFLRHKNSMISPNQLKAFGIPVYKTLQSEGEFVITFPTAYHSGFNLGFNIAEAVNFATLRWVPFGLRARVCKCSPESVRIDMDDFLISLFSSGKAKSDDIPEDAWVFSCRCKMYSSSEDPSFCVDREWFECSRCKIWCHVHCIHPDQASEENTELPDSILCHRCQSGDKDVLSIGSKRKRVQKRKRREKKLPKQKNNRTSDALRGSKSLMKLSKGINVFLDGYEARVTAVDGKYARIHYKGYSADCDEWLPRTGQELAKRNLTSL